MSKFKDCNGNVFNKSDYYFSGDGEDGVHLYETCKHETREGITILNWHDVVMANKNNKKENNV